MPLPAGDDHRRALRPRPANCSPAMIMAQGSETSLAMHSSTTRRATRLVEATREISATDSTVVRRSTICRESRPSTLLILHQLFDSGAKFELPRLRLLHHRGRRVAHELLVAQPRGEAVELLAALFQLALRALELLLRHHALRELDGDVEAFDHVVVRPFGRLGVDGDIGQPR